MNKQKIAILGASRGLGRAFSEKLLLEKGFDELFISSRKAHLLAEIEDALLKEDLASEVFTCDFSDIDQQMKLIERLEDWCPDQIFYFAGGGPHGLYGSKEWKDHEWALQVTQIFPMKIFSYLHKKIDKFVLVGSAVAESSADPLASSYAAAKHGIKGWHKSVVAEGLDLDFRLFSPSYMDTDLLPSGAKPRQGQGALLDPKKVADALWKWAQDGQRNSCLIYDAH